MQLNFWIVSEKMGLFFKNKFTQLCWFNMILGFVTQAGFPMKRRPIAKISELDVFNYFTFLIVIE